MAQTRTLSVGLHFLAAYQDLYTVDHPTDDGTIVVAVKCTTDDIELGSGHQPESVWASGVPLISTAAAHPEFEPGAAVVKWLIR